MLTYIAGISHCCPPKELAFRSLVFGQSRNVWRRFVTYAMVSLPSSKIPLATISRLLNFELRSSQIWVEIRC
jgi:hypothetical protein